MKKYIMICTYIFCVFVLSACSSAETKTEHDRVKIGIMLSDTGLGDQSFSDLGFAGLEKARDELGISFDYRELQDTNTYEQGLEELVKEGNDLIIGLGFAIQEAMEMVAKKYPDTSFFNH